MKKRAFTVSDRYGNSPAGSRSGSRSSRLADRRQKRRKRLATVILIAGVLIAGGVFIIGSLNSRSNSPRIDIEPLQQQSGDVAIGVYGAEGALEHVLVALTEEEGGYSVITIPARTIVETPDDGFRRLDALAAGDKGEQLVAALEGLLQVSLGHYISIDRQTLEAAAGKAGSINFSTDTAVSTGGGSIVLQVGDNPLSPAEALDHLDASLDDIDNGSMLQTLFFRGMRDAFSSMQDQDRQGVASWLAASLDSDLDEKLVADLITGMSDPGQSFGLWALPVTVAGAGEDWYYEPVLSQVEALLQGSNLAQDFNLEVQNGTETTGLVEAIGTKLAPLRYNINLNTATSGVNYDHTQVRCGSDALKECERVVVALGSGTIIKDEYLDSRQIIVIIGMDLAQPGQ